MTLRRRRYNVLTVVGIILLVLSVKILGGYYFGHGRAGPTLSSASLPPGVGPSLSLSSSSAPALSSAPAPARSPAAVQVKTAIPVAVIAADHHLRATVSANRLNADGSLYVPPDPKTVSWASQDVAPGSGFGTIILVGHINYGGDAGAFADLADYRTGQIITLVLADGRRMKYAVAAPPLEVKKDKLGSRRQELFDQTQSYGLPGSPRSGRLLLLSCGGTFDNRTGHYESNIFVYALPA